MQPTTISPLEVFQRHFPSINLIATDEELRYRFKSKLGQQVYDKIAQRIILREGLRITADWEVWQSGAVVHEIALVVKPVPEESLIAR